MKESIYRSFAESFLLDVYLPETSLISPPVATCWADHRLADVMQNARPPQAVIFTVDAALDIFALNGEKIGSLYDGLMAIKGKAVPILCVDQMETVEPLAQFADDHCLGDVTLCVPFEKREILQSLRLLMPLSRGMLDGRQCMLPPAVELAGDCHEAEATMVLMNADANRAYLRALQKRFIQVWVDAGDDWARAACMGACGVICPDVKKLYDGMDRFPARSTLRPTPLYAHKAYHVTGEYPENSLSATVASAKHGYDAAEIDIKPTRDGVVIVHHDLDTGNLFKEKKVIAESDWEELAPLRRKAFPDQGLDLFEDLMQAMAPYPETPVLIEIKPPAATFRLEETVRQMKKILARTDVQQGCTCIMGPIPPYLGYVHKHLPRLPLSHCRGGKREEHTDDVQANNLRIYQFALDTQGANAGYNPRNISISAIFTRLAHIRGMTVFPWSWAFEMWEGCGAALTQGYLDGHDGLTSDWVTKFAHVPVDIQPAIATKYPADKPLPLKAKLLSRTGEWTETEENLELLPLSGDWQQDAKGLWRCGKGEGCFLLGCRIPLPDDQDICLMSMPFQVKFE